MGGGTHEGDIYYYKIEINPHQVQLVQEVNGKKLPIKLMDYIDPKIDTDPTYIRIRSINADGSEQYRLDAETHTNTFPDEIKPAVRYNDDTRMLTIENLQDQTHYSIEYPVRLRAQWASGEDEKEFKVTNTVTMQASGTWSATVTNTHKEQKVNAGFDVPLTLQKVDENDATVPLKDAVFEVYKLSTDPTTGLITDWPGTKINKAGESDNSASFTSDNDGKVVFSINTFQEETLYYWKEIEAPTGYLLVDTPHYFIVYKEDSNGNTSRMKAWAMDNLCTAANGITIASISQGTTWMVTNSKTRSIMVTKRWNADYDNIYKTRPESVTVNLIRIDYLGNRTQIDSVVLYPAADGNWQAYTNYIWNNLPAHEEDHPERPYTYTVEEEYVKNYVAVYSDNQEGVTNGGITITNRLIPSKTNIYLEKKWNNAETADLPDHITVTLQQIHKDADGNVGAPAPATTIPGYVVTLTPDSEGHWTYEWTNLPTRDGQGGEYTYTVKETVPEGFTVTYSDDNRGVLESTSANPLVITNTAVGSLKVTKSFTGFTPGSLTQAQKEAIHFTVKNIAEETVAQFTYADMLGGEKTIENLPAGIYTVTETRAEGSDPADYVWQEATYTVNGTPSGNGEVTVVINQTATVGVTNTPQDGGLRITKSVTINGNEPNGSDLADGTYTFVIKKNGTPINEGMVGTTAVVDGEVAITISGGVAQTVDVTGLTPGIYTITESTPTNGTTLTAASGGNSVDANNVVTVTVTAGKSGSELLDTGKASFTNNINTTSLEISKTVISPVPADSTKTFTFTVAVTKADGTALTGTFGGYTFTSGQTTVTTTGTQTVTITGLPQGAAWTVTETADSDFNADKVSENGTLTAEPSTAAFTNTRKTGSLTVTKSLQGEDDDAAPTGTYTYPIKVTTIIGSTTYYVAESSGTYSLTETVAQLSVTNGNTLTINNLPVSNNGTALTYKVEEVDPGSIVITDYTNVNVSGTTVETVENIAVTETTAGTANLVNVYERDKGSLKIQKTVQLNGQDTTDAKLDGTYTFTVVSADGVTPATSKTVAMTFSSGTVTAATIRNTSDDEASATALTVTDGTVQIDGLPTGSYTVAEDTNSLTNGISLLGTNDQTINVAKDQTSGIPTASFTNNKPYVTQTPVVTKKLNGVDFTGTNGAGTAVSFEFTLNKVIIGGTDENPTYTVDSGAALQTKTTAANGSITFDAIEFTQAGTYIFRIAETGTDNDTMDYADPIYVKIEVTGSNGVLTAAEPAYYSDIECTQSLTNATFENTELTQISAKKTWSSSDLWPDNMSVTFEVEQYKGEARQTEFATTAAENGNVTSVTIASQKTVNWTHLPKYYLNDSDQVQPYTYKVVETAMLDNGTLLTDYRTYYTVAGEGEGENGIVTIDNTPKTTSIKVTKEWKRSNDPVKNRESISYTLYKKYAQTTESVNVTAAQLAADPGTAEVGKVKYVSENGGGWQTVTISNLPMYERVVTTEGETTTVTYSPISYYVVESNAAADPGYVLTTAYRADNGAETTAEGAAVSTNDATITIINTETAGVTLPSTGGPGTAAYTASGLALILGALWMLLRRRREQN
ncbi:MAG: Cna B-type domain-containing protein [Clostridia bacterium]|nr:Cna B-type domain-containing protein [Clostridia bacterium]